MVKDDDDNDNNDPFACFGDDDNDEDDEDDEDDEYKCNEELEKPKIAPIQSSKTSSQKTTDTDDNDTGTGHDEIRRRLIEKANQRHDTTSANGNVNVDATRINDPSLALSDSVGTPSPSSLRTPISLTVWPHRPPLYLGPMIVVRPSPPTSSNDNHSNDDNNSISNNNNNTIGGNRGYIAARDLPPGTLLLVEEPIYTWPSAQIGEELGLASIMEIFRPETADEGDTTAVVGRRSTAQEIVRDMELLHPTRRRVDALCRRTSGGKGKGGDAGAMMSDDGGGDEVESVQIVDMMEQMRMKFSEDPLLATVLKLAKENGIVTGGRMTKSGDGQDRLENEVVETMDNVTEEEESFFDEIDVYRTMLALRYNGFGSGIYLHFAMFNHDDDPNCIKYTPEHNDRSETNTINTITTKFTPRHYSELRTTTHVRRGDALTLHYLDPREISHATRRHHLWDQHRFDIGNNADATERINNTVPPSSIHPPPPNNTAITPDVENALTQLEELQRSSREASNSSTSGRAEASEQTRTLEAASFELLTVSVARLGNDRHVLLIRCCRLHLDAVESLLRDGGMGGRKRQEALCRFLPTCRRLAVLQMGCLGSDHPDLARTYLDMAMGIGGLLSDAPQKLFALQLEDIGGGGGMENFHQCSREEDRCRKEHVRIRDLYPRDVEERLEARR